MKLFATCNVGFESFLKEELIARGFTEVLEGKGFCTTPCDSYDKIVEFAYVSKICVRAGLLIANGKVSEVLDNNTDLLKKDISNFDFSFIHGKTFRAECERVGEHQFHSNDFERLLGGLIFDAVGDLTVNLKDPDVNIYSHVVDDEYVFGIDFIGFDNNKRDYKIFNNPHSIRGDIGSIAGRLAVKDLKKGVVIDTFCADGVVGIETIFFLTDRSVNFYRKKEFIFKKLNFDIDWRTIFSKVDNAEKDVNLNFYCFDPFMGSIKAASKNAKIAGVDKKLNVSRVTIEDIEFKFEKKSIDRFVTLLPVKNKHVDEKKLEIYYNHFFDQADYLLKKAGKIVLIANNDHFLPFAEKYKFKIIDVVTPLNNRKIFILSK